jgi:hypothetical protein
VDIGEIIEIGERKIETPALRPARPAERPAPSAPQHAPTRRVREKEPA